MKSISTEYMEQDLTSFQEFAVHAISEAIKDGKSVIPVQIITGAGRSLIIRKLVYSGELRNKKVLIIVRSNAVKAHLADTFGLSKNESSLITLAALSEANQEILTPFDVIISLDISIDKELIPIINVKQLNNSTIISFVTSLSKSEMKAYGSPLLKYDITNAVQDGLYVPVEYRLCNKIGIKNFFDINLLNQFFDQFIKDFYARDFRQAIVICPSTETVAEMINFFEAKNFRVSNIDSKKSERLQGNKEILLTSRINLIGVPLPVATDVLLLRSISKDEHFQGILSHAMQPINSKKVAFIWDFGDNVKFFDNTYGRIVEGYKIETINEFNEEIPSEKNAPTTKKSQEESVIKQKYIVPVGDNVSDEDLLGRGRLLHVLKGLIRDTKSRNFRPFVIGLFGKWGAGKSTVTHLLKKEFSNDKDFSFLSFNAWQNEHCTHMGAALAHRLVEQLFHNKNIFTQMFLSFLQNVLRQRDFIGVSLVVTAIIAPLVGISLSGDKIFNFVESGAWPSFIKDNILVGFAFGFISFAAAVIQSYWKKPFTSKICKLAAKPDYSAHLGVSEQIKQEVHSLFKIRGYGKNYVFRYFISIVSKINFFKQRGGVDEKAYHRQFIVVIDDLDRCSDSKIFEVLEAIRLIIDVQNVIVIFCVDQSILISAVANRFSAQNKNLKWDSALGLARDFLGKIIQVAIELDNPDSRQTRHFVAKRLYSGLTDAESVSKGIHQGRQLGEVANGGESEYDDAWAQANSPITLEELFEHEAEDDIVEDSEKSEDYLEGTIAEAGTFSKCIGAFEINNPRTLVRIHNTITILKGLYPEISASEKLLNVYIFFSFLQECYAMRSPIAQKELSSIFDINEKQRSTFAIRLRKLGEEFCVFQNFRSEIRKVASRVRKLSLASVTGLTTANDNLAFPGFPGEAVDA